MTTLETLPSPSPPTRAQQSAAIPSTLHRRASLASLPLPQHLPSVPHTYLDPTQPTQSTRPDPQHRQPHQTRLTRLQRTPNVHKAPVSPSTTPLATRHDCDASCILSLHKRLPAPSRLAMFGRRMQSLSTGPRVRLPNVLEPCKTPR